MFDSANIIVGLDLGTSKVCAVVGEVSANGALNIIGIGQARSRGVRKGEIVDASAAEEDVRVAIAEAEQMANVEIRSVFLGVTGGHIRGLNNSGFHPIVSADREITEEDVQDVIKNAKAVNLPQDHNHIHYIRQHFAVDGQHGITNPTGMLGAKLEVDLHVIHGHVNRLQNPMRVVRGLQLQIEEIAFNGLASALALLTSEQKELGALVIDIGGGTTEYVVYVNGILKHSGVLAVGGDHVSNDVGYGLKIPLGRAEQFKIEHGAAAMDETVRGKTVVIPSDFGLPERTVNLDHMRQIMVARLEEIFELIARNLAEEQLLSRIRSGVYLCGGGARIPKIQVLADRVFQLPTYIGRTNSINGLKSALDQPEFATAIGLVKFGSFQQKRRTTSGLFGALADIFRR
jgi:cell division protein FtsA